MQRFYINLDFSQNISLKDKDLVHQMTKVLRVRKWEEIILFSHLPNPPTEVAGIFDYIYEIKEISRKEIKLELIRKIENNSELNVNVNLIQALPNKLSKIEDIIKKWTQIWIHKFIFFKSERSQKLNINTNKISRLNKIMIESVEQSWRSYIPELKILEENIFNKNIKSRERNFSFTTENNYQSNLIFPTEKSLNFFFHTKDNESKLLKGLNYLDIIKNYKNINLIIWPEWGFSEKEINIFNELKYLKIYLWNRILRTETTWVVAWFYIIQNLI